MQLQQSLGQVVVQARDCQADFVKYIAAHVVCLCTRSLFTTAELMAEQRWRDSTLQSELQGLSGVACGWLCVQS